MSKNTKSEVKPVDAAGSSTELGRKRRRRMGLISLISTIVVIAALIAFNYFVDYIADRYVLEIDMTATSEYEISDETAQLLETLTEDITITVLCDETDYADDADLRRLPKVLQRYVQLSGGKVTVNYVNAVTNPGIFTEYNELGDLSTGDIIVESEKRYMSMSPYDLPEYTSDSSDSDTYYLTGLRAEQRLTSAILYVTANKVPKAAFITGHQETTNLDTMESLLTSGNYDVTTLSLMTEGEVPADVDLLIISQPLGDYTEDEIQIIDDFMNDGGRMIVTYATNTPSLPNLDAYFEEWGVRYENELVYDTERGLAGYPIYILPNLTTVEGITDNIPSSGYSVVVGARPITTLWETDNWRGTQVLMTTSNSAYAQDLSYESMSGTQTDDSSSAEVDNDAPFTLGVLAYQAEMHNLDSTYSYILFLNAGFVSDSVLGDSSFLNKSYFLAALNFLSDDSETVVIESKDLTSEVLVVPSSAKRVIYYLLIFIIPGGCLVVGIVVWAKRRHK